MCNIMLPENALDNITFNRNIMCYNCNPTNAFNDSACIECKDYLSYKVAVDAIKKQIPIKPKIRYDNGIRLTGCPICSNVDFGYYTPSYCENCGQKIDWDFT